MKRLSVLWLAVVLVLGFCNLSMSAWNYNSGDLYDKGCLQDGMDILATSDTAGVFYPVSVLGGTNNTQAITIRGLVYFQSAAQFAQGTTNAVSVQGTNDANTGLNFDGDNSASLVVDGKRVVQGTNSVVIFAPTGAEMSRINSVGLGIGTNNPAYPLHVNSSASDQVYVKGSGNYATIDLDVAGNNTATFQIRRAGISRGGIGINENNSVVISDAYIGLSNIAYFSAGKLGVGNAAPTNTVDVLGSFSASGKAMIGSITNPVMTGKITSTATNMAWNTLTANTNGLVAGDWYLSAANAIDGATGRVPVVFQ